MFAGYKKIRTMKVVRTKHHVSARIGQRKIDLMASFSNVPDKAILIDILEEPDSDLVMEFKEEQEVTED